MAPLPHPPVAHARPPLMQRRGQALAVFSRQRIVRPQDLEDRDHRLAPRVVAIATMAFGQSQEAIEESKIFQLIKEFR